MPIDPVDTPQPDLPEERFRGMVDASPIPIWMTGTGGGLSFANRAYLEFFGMTQAQALATDWAALVHPDDVAEYAAAYCRAFSARAPFHAEARVRRGDGTWRWVATRAHPHHDAGGGFLGYIGLSPDVTDHRETEAALRASRAELATLADRLDAALEEERARIAADLHDELGQLLTALKMDLRTVERRLEALPPGPTAAAVLEAAVDASELASRAIASVQEIASTLRPGVLERLGLGAALDQEARQFQRRSGVACAVEEAGLIPPLSAEVAMALYRIAVEALTNVARHAAATRATIRLEVRDAEARLTVTDDGRGFDPDRTGPALGLVTMRQRAARLGGSAMVERGAAGGTVVRALLPLGAMAPLTGSTFEQSLHAALEGIPGPVFVYRSDGTLEWANRRLWEYTGLTLEGLLRSGPPVVFHPEDLAAMEASWVGAFSAERAGTILARIRRHDGAYRRFKCAVAPVRDHRGRVVRWIGTWTDVEELLPPA